MGNEQTARRWLTKAIAWQEANAAGNEMLGAFRKEAEALVRPG